MRAEQKRVEVLIIGLGNPLAGDDGLGPLMVHYLRECSLPEGVKVIEGGSDAFALLPELERAERVIVMDVIQTGGRPGTIYRIPLRHLLRQRGGFSQHDISLLTLYQLPFSRWQLSLPDGILFAVEAGEIDLFCDSVSPALREVCPKLAGHILQEVQGMTGDSNPEGERNPSGMEKTADTQKG